MCDVAGSSGEVRHPRGQHQLGHPVRGQQCPGGLRELHLLTAQLEQLQACQVIMVLKITSVSSSLFC